MAKAKSGKKIEVEDRGTPVTRASVSFPSNVYGSLEAIARKKKVSLAWVVRDASEKYIAEEANEGRGEHPSHGRVRQSEGSRDSS
jgi:metal-responsive CopG/Arc/MetJ family transcriptional regulator